MKINIKHIAKLANLSISEEEEKKFDRQLSIIVKYIEKLKEADVENTEETSQITGLENVTREDKTTSSLSQDEALSNTKNKHNGLFKVPKII